jgi:hypothetical protein
MLRKLDLATKQQQGSGFKGNLLSSIDSGLGKWERWLCGRCRKNYWNSWNWLKTADELQYAWLMGRATRKPADNIPVRGMLSPVKTGSWRR